MDGFGSQELETLARRAHTEVHVNAGKETEQTSEVHIQTVHPES